MHNIAITTILPERKQSQTIESQDAEMATGDSTDQKLEGSQSALALEDSEMYDGGVMPKGMVSTPMLLLYSFLMNCAIWNVQGAGKRGFRGASRIRLMSLAYLNQESWEIGQIKFVGASFSRIQLGWSAIVLQEVFGYSGMRRLETTV
ncbi:hypothetical protein V2J09_013797 [Rumex salicifolius]